MNKRLVAVGIVCLSLSAAVLAGKRVVVAAAPTPFGGTPWPVPGTIQAENFDDGGEGSAYHDTTSGNNGGVYRTTGVDLEATSDTGGGYNVAHTRVGEWLSYTVDVATTGSYLFEFRVANASTGAKFHLELDGVNLTGPLSVPNTGGFQTWQTITRIRTVSAGQHVFRLVYDIKSSGNAGCGNLNWLRVTLEDPPPPPPCEYVVTPTSLQVAADGGLSTVSVTTDTGCSWAAASDQSWATVSPASGTGSGPVTVTVAANPTTEPRTATVTVAGQEVAVTQDGQPPPPPSEPARAFPGAEGFGVETRHAYAGPVSPVVLPVTNLNDSGAGSLRAALLDTRPRVVIFATSGTIQLTGKIIITSPYLYVAGQTAPSPGITLRNGGLSVRAHDILIRHIRIRVGDDPDGDPATNRDGLELLGPKTGWPGASNVVIDHVSVSWGVDETASTFHAGLHDITISNSIVSESLLNSLKGVPNSRGLLLGREGKRIAVLRNLLIHNQDRNPVWGNGTEAVVVNNVMYNWGSAAASQIALGENDLSSNPFKMSHVNNVFIRGTSTTSPAYAVRFREAAAGSQSYISGNMLIGSNLTLLRNDLTFNPVVSTPPIWPGVMTLLSGVDTETVVRATVGARPLDRDAVDARLIQHLTTRTGEIIDSPSQVGGWPILDVNVVTHVLPGNPHETAANGYTNMENWLTAFADALEP
jgi:hypothetical protein